MAIDQICGTAVAAAHLMETHCRQDLFKFSTSSPAFKSRTAWMSVFSVSWFVSFC